MNLENVIRVLMKIMGISDQQMRETFEKGQSLVVDGSERIATIDRRLERIERAMGISETNETKALTDGRERNGPESA